MYLLKKKLNRSNVSEEINKKQAIFEKIESEETIKEHGEEKEEVEKKD